MDSKHIEQLLEKYWECETSLEEEKALRDFFSQTDVPDALKDSAVLFRYFEQQRQHKMNDVAFDASLKNKLQPAQGKMRSLLMSSLRIAAGISVVVASFWLVRTQMQNNAQQEITDTFDDPKEAFEETKKALQLISKNFGKAKKATSNINMINEATERVHSKDETKIDS